MSILYPKKLGKLVVSGLGFGCVNLSGLYGEPIHKTSDILQHAFNHGINFFDTADAYGNGQNEIMLSSLYSSSSATRQKIILATKCGVVWDRKDAGYSSTDNSPAYIKSACESSLKRLKTDYIDLFYLHRIAAEGEYIEASMHALVELVQEGKIGHIGLSEVRESILRRAHAIYPITAIQSEYSLMTRNPEENGILSTCRELDIGFVAYSPLCRGLLSEHFDLTTLSSHDFRHKLPRFKQENLAINQKLVQELAQMAHEKQCTIAQLSLAWVAAQGNNIVPLPGTKSLHRIKENTDAIGIELYPTELEQLNQLFPLGRAAGERYPQAFIRNFNLS